MDGETIRLIVVALSAIIGGVGGQLIAGAFNSQNTLTTIDAAREAAAAQRESDSEAEYERWLRDRKVVAYTKFMSQLQEIDLLVQDTHMFPEVDASRLPELAAKLNGDELMLIVPKEVQSAMRAIFPALRTMLATTVEIPSGEQRAAAYKVAAEDFVDKYGKLRAVIRKDLGIED